MEMNMTAETKKSGNPKPGEAGKEELGALADAAKGAAERAGAAVDDALEFVDASEARIARIELEAKKKHPEKKDAL